LMLESKSVLVFAASGAIGSGVARACAREGAHVWLSGRNASTLEALASSTEADGVKATPDVVDALDQAAVETYVNRVVETVGGIDAVFNAIGLPPAELGYPAPSTTQDLEMFLEPARVIVGSTFVTARVAAVPMMRRGHGSIVTLCATLSGIAAPYMAGISAECGAIEVMTRSLAGEFGPAGVRVNCVRGSAMSETRTIRETSAEQARLQEISLTRCSYPPPRSAIPSPSPRSRATAAFLASDASSGMTGQVVTVAAGDVV
jgi:3-oxoacyl-[acyl-carrier protein] reductase